MHAIYQIFQRFRVNFGISIDLDPLLGANRAQVKLQTYHKANLEEVRSDTHENVDFPEQIEIERAHPIVVGDT